MTNIWRNNWRPIIEGLEALGYRNTCVSFIIHRRSRHKDLIAWQPRRPRTKLFQAAEESSVSCSVYVFVTEIIWRNSRQSIIDRLEGLGYRNTCVSFIIHRWTRQKDSIARQPWRPHTKRFKYSISDFREEITKK